MGTKSTEKLILPIILPIVFSTNEHSLPNADQITDVNCPRVAHRIHFRQRIMLFAFFHFAVIGG